MKSHIDLLPSNATCKNYLENAIMYVKYSEIQKNICINFDGL